MGAIRIQDMHPQDDYRRLQNGEITLTEFAESLARGVERDFSRGERTGRRPRLDASRAESAAPDMGRGLA